jgi:hypothetical protein
LNALRNLTCDVLEITEKVATDESLRIFSNLILLNFNKICQLQEELSQLQRDNANNDQLEATQSKLKDCREILFGICSLIWNLSENDNIRLKLFKNCFNAVSTVAFSTEYSDEDILYFIAMVFANLVSNREIQIKYKKDCLTIVKLLESALQRLDPSKKIRTEWGSFDPLYRLLAYDPNADEQTKLIQISVGAWSLFVFANLSFRKSYQKRLISEGGIGYLIKAIRTRNVRHQRLAWIALKNFMENAATRQRIPNSELKECLFILSKSDDKEIASSVSSYCSMCF